jgi:hypothetical protein
MVRKTQVLVETIFGLQLLGQTAKHTHTHTHTHINGVDLNTVTTSLILGKRLWKISIFTG